MIAMVHDISGAVDTELARLQQECLRLAAQISAQDRELACCVLVWAYETALRGSQVTVYTQDRDLRYTSISNPILGRAIEDILGPPMRRFFRRRRRDRHCLETRGACDWRAEARGIRAR